MKFPRGRPKWFSPELTKVGANDLDEIADYIDGVATRVSGSLASFAE